jgi:ATP-dependent helicase/nuclease subunit A
MSLTSAQKKAAYAKGSVSVTAGAGTGKTHMLAERYLHHLKNDVDSPLEIVTLTFTDKAAAEMRSRIRQTVAAGLSDRPDMISELEAAPISTFHALAARICREHPQEAGIPVDFGLLDEMDAKLWRLDNLAIAISQLPIQYFDQIPYSLMSAALESFLDDPLSAESALRQTQSAWLPEMEMQREVALKELLNHPVWNESVTILETYHGTADDKLEMMRQDAVEAIAQITLPEQTKAALTAISELKINVGSKKNWKPAESIDEVKDAIKAIRELVKDSLKEGLITLEISWVDEQVEEILPILQQAFEQVRSHLQQEKQNQRVLDFTDLEVGALKALQQPEVQDYYTKRWKVFLVDEFQDTNPVQGKLLQAIAKNAILTIVGDAKQSIYAFRRADVGVFKQWCQKIESEGGESVSLDRSFRTHQPLMNAINQVFAPVLGNLHQDLYSEQIEPHAAPHLQVYAVEELDPTTGDKTTIDSRRFVEAQHIADKLATLIADGVEIFDKQTQQLRPIGYGDIAILSRTWAPLEIYGQALENRGIPIVQAGGGSLLQTREAKDGLALLQFLADPTDDLALVALLRSPFFAVSDPILFQFSQSLPQQMSWWRQMKLEQFSELAVPLKVLMQLLLERQTEPPSQLLQRVDQLTGYTAVIANLAGCDRREADWRGFVDFVRNVEQGNHEVLNVVRRLKRLVENEIDIPRPTLAGSNAVSLMTIHRAKGLEWSVVVVPDLTRPKSTTSPKVYFDPAWGVGLKLKNKNGEDEPSILHTLLEKRQKACEQDEAKRVLYVALTRARDRLILTAAGEKGGNLELLQPGLAENYPIETIAFDPDRAKPLAPTVPKLPSIPSKMLLGASGAGLTTLPVTALTEYDQCPKRFQLRYMLGHPRIKTGAPSTFAAEIGTLTHKILEQQVQDKTDLLHIDLPESDIQDAWNLAQQFRTHSTYADYQEGNWEQLIQLSMGGITWNGNIDLTGNDFILDVKTDQEMNPHHHRLQLWAYAKATGKEMAHIAYLRHGVVHSFNAAELLEIEKEAEAIAQSISEGNFQPTASHHRCAQCPYSEICDEATLTAY